MPAGGSPDGVARLAPAGACAPLEATGCSTRGGADETTSVRSAGATVSGVSTTLLGPIGTTNLPPGSGGVVARGGGLARVNLFAVYSVWVPSPGRSPRAACRGPLRLVHLVVLVVAVGDGVVPAQFDEAFVEGVRDHVVVVRGGFLGAAQDVLQLERRAHAAEGEVAQPQLVVGEARRPTGSIEDGSCLLGHGAFATPFTGPKHCHAAEPAPRARRWSGGFAMSGSRGPALASHWAITDHIDGRGHAQQGERSDLLDRQRGSRHESRRLRAQRSAQADPPEPSLSKVVLTLHLGTTGRYRRSPKSAKLVGEESGHGLHQLRDHRRRPHR